MKIAEQFQPLMQWARLKGAYGGRGSAKSHFAAEEVVRHCHYHPGTRFMCLREVQRDLKQSAKLLIEDKIRHYGLGYEFDVKQHGIRTPGGGILTFQGLSQHTADSLKSYENFDGAWIEEAHSTSRRSIRLLTPTLRKDNAYLIATWNPQSPEDPIDEMFRSTGNFRDPRAISVHATWQQNPWFPRTLWEDMQADRRRNADDFEHVWNGAYQTVTDAVIFSRKIQIKQFDPPEGTRFFFGADWGFAVDPTVLVRFWIDDAEDDLYIDHAVYGSQVELDEIPALFDRVPGSRDWTIKADSSRPETISHIARKGFHIREAEKWDGSIEDGIAHLKAFRHIFIHERCTELQREGRLYSYKVDPKNGDILPFIVDKFNHGWDAIRYGLDGYIQRRGVDWVWSRL